MIQKFLIRCNMKGMFDQEFWDYVEEITEEKNQVYTIWPYSLMQHCNVGESHYGNEVHAYGEAYDPRIQVP